MKIFIPVGQRWLLRWLVAAAVFMLMGLAPPASEAARHAMLVGVSSYPGLPSDMQLVGPKNDVALVNKMLVQRGFSKKNILILSDGVKTGKPPTRKAILNGLRLLAERAQNGDFVYLHFSGHGSRQPESGNKAKQAETDGLDEIFLPKDIGRWDNAIGAVKNAIIDDEIGAAIRKIRARGAFVWAVFDSCHSGTMTRGVPVKGLRMRKVDPVTYLGIPADAMGGTRRRSAGDPARKKAPLDTAPKRGGSGMGGFVAFYAAQTTEETPELSLPVDAKKGRSQGLFTYTLMQVLASNPSITYRQASQQIIQNYAALGWRRTTPLFEGDLDRGVFGKTPVATQPQWRIKKKRGVVKVLAGSLHQLSAGSILAVLPSATAGDDEALGYVKVEDVDLLSSTVVGVGYLNKPAPNLEQIPRGAFARLAAARLSLLLKVAHPPHDVTQKGQHERVGALLQQISRDEVSGLMLKWVKSGDKADIRLVIRADQIWLLPPSGALVTEGPRKTHSVSLRRNDKEVRQTLVDTLVRIAKVTNLLRLSRHMQISNTRVEVSLQVQRIRSGKTESISPEQVPVLYHDDKLILKVVNADKRKAVDVSVLFVDSGYGIAPLYPESYESNRIEAGGQKAIEIGEIDASTTVGLERLLIIAVKAKKNAPRAEFSFLAQKSVPRTRAAAESNLHFLLRQAGFGFGTTRGQAKPASADMKQASILLFSWETSHKPE